MKKCNFYFNRFKISGTNLSYRFLLMVSTGMLFGLLTACNDDKAVLNNNTITFTEFLQKDSIKFRNLCKYEFGDTQRLYVADSSLIIFNFRKSCKFFLYQYKLNKGVFSKGYVKKGRGPGEVLGGACMGITGNTMWVYDITKKNIITINKDDVLLNGDFSDFKEYRVKGDYYKICFIDSLSYLGVVNPEKKSKLSRVDLLNGKEYSELGEFGTMPEGIPLRAFKDAYTSYICAKPSGNKVVLPYRYTDVIEIYDIKNGDNVAIQGPECFDVEWEVHAYSNISVMGKTEKTRKAFVQACVTDKYIYALHSGHYNTHENWSYGKEIYVYDWEGRPIRKIVLDRYIYSLAVSKDDKTLYSHDRETGFLLVANMN